MIITNYWVPVTGYWVLLSKYLVPGIWYLLSVSCYQLLTHYRDNGDNGNKNKNKKQQKLIKYKERILPITRIKYKKSDENKF
jgi:hypothetical protein